MNLAPILITLGGGLLALVLAIYFCVSAGRGGGTVWLRRTCAATIMAAVARSAKPTAAAFACWRAVPVGSRVPNSTGQQLNLPTTY